jgi:hypothetical protein
MAEKKRGLKDRERKAYALRMAIQLGCSGAHKMPDGSWAPCSSMEEMSRLSDAAESDDWTSQNTIGALRSRDRKARRQKVKDLQENVYKSGLYWVVSGKSAVPMNSPRDTDPDVYLDPDSARLRSRQLGCIGISRRISKSGRSVWMPCTNNSDYARLSRTTALGRRGSDASETRRIRETVQSELRKLSKKR